MDGKRFLFADTSLTWGDGSWSVLAAVAGTGAILFSLGIPYGLYRTARSVHGTDATPSQEKFHSVSFISSPYLPRFWYFESVDLLQKLLNTAVVAVAWQGTHLQLWFGAVAATISLFAYGMLQPYKDPLCNRSVESTGSLY
jgi:hypothetical protein